MINYLFHFKVQLYYMHIYFICDIQFCCYLLVSSRSCLAVVASIRWFKVSEATKISKFRKGHQNPQSWPMFRGNDDFCLAQLL